MRKLKRIYLLCFSWLSPEDLKTPSTKTVRKNEMLGVGRSSRLEKHCAEDNGTCPQSTLSDSMTKMGSWVVEFTHQCSSSKQGDSQRIKTMQVWTTCITVTFGINPMAPLPSKAQLNPCIQERGRSRHRKMMVMLLLSISSHYQITVGKKKKKNLVTMATRFP